MGGVRWVAFHRDILNALNVYPVPDGDTGTNMYLTLRGAVSSFRLATDSSMGSLLKTLAQGALFGARGNSGVILSQILSGFARYFKDRTLMAVHDIAPAWRSASERAYQAVSKPQEGTILTVVRVIAEELEGADLKDLLQALEIMNESGKRILQQSRDLLPILKDNDVVDAGGQGLLYLLEGMLRAARSEDFQRLERENMFPAMRFGVEEPEYRYCVEFLLACEADDFRHLRSELLKLGDSLVLGPAGDVVKIHLHTDYPDEVMNLVGRAGKIMRQKKDDMKAQHRSLFFEDTPVPSESALPPPSDLQTAVAAVVTGDGLIDVFNGSGAFVIDGGTTMNPSVEEIVSVLSRISAPHVLLLPNNGNCVAPCEQAVALLGRSATVLPTGDLVSGLLCLSCYDPSKDIEDIVARYHGCRKRFRVLGICQASRRSVLNQAIIEEGEWIALADERLMASAPNAGSLMKRLSSSAGEVSHITIVRGSDPLPGIDDPLLFIKEEFSAEADFIYGGQRHYPLLLGFQYHSEPHDNQ